MDQNINKVDGLQCYIYIGSKRAFPTGVLDKWHNCLLIYWCTSCL